MPIKVAVIGSNGLLGQTLVNKLHLNIDYTLYALAAGKNRNSKVPDLNYFKIDLVDFKSIKIQLNLLNPDFVINALAMTNVDACETEKEFCDLVNVSFVEELSNICSEINAHLIHISTDFIFDGDKGLYAEMDKQNPVNYYGHSKLASEKKVQEILENYTILRTILVYGKVANMKRSNIVLWVKKSLENGDAIQIVDDQFRMPTYVGSLADACLLVMNLKARGVFHIAGKDLLSIYDIAQQIADFYNLPKSLVQPIPTTKLKQKAKRPPKTGFVMEKAINQLGFQPLSFVEGLMLLENEL